MKYNEKVERFAPKLGRKNLANGLSCPPFVYMEDSEDGMWVHYAKYCEAIAKLKARIHELENMPHTDNSAVIENLINKNEALKKELTELHNENKSLKYRVDTDFALDTLPIQKAPEEK